MASRGETGVPHPPSRGRCRCGHLATHHMVVKPVEGSASFRLEPSGPCQVCGEALCRKFTPGGKLTPASVQP
ncbi:MAG: hypothetical protein ACLQD9_03165 [Thermoplasmata archaeon]|nr:hypothetical protein [Thermoplasmata archaeon]